jgi:membrane protease YdiL (CAAX protease family)
VAVRRPGRGGKPAGRPATDAHAPGAERTAEGAGPAPGSPHALGEGTPARAARAEVRHAGDALLDGDTFLDTIADLHPRRFFGDSWRLLDRVGAADREARAAAGLGWDGRPLVALVVGALMLTAMEYVGHRPTFLALVDRLADTGPSAAFWLELRLSRFLELAGFVWWTGWRVLGYFLVPALVVKVAFKDTLRAYGLETRGVARHLWVYGLFFALVLVGVVVVSYTSEFSTYYPFYKQAHRSWAELLAWEAMYAAQFFSLEFFFRGFWLRACRGAMGSHAIFAMVVPYCMIHYGKPAAETIGAILAGIALGTLAMRTRSIWGGFLIHVSVAFSMDIAALLQTRGLPSSFWP